MLTVCWRSFGQIILQLLGQDGLTNATVSLDDQSAGRFLDLTGDALGVFPWYNLINSLY